MAKKVKKKEEHSLAENILLEGTKTKEINRELETYIDEKINKVFVDELDKANKRLLREKNRKIIVRNIIIILLLGIIGFLVYLMYTNNYFDKFFHHDKTEIIEKEENKEETKKEEKKEEVKVEQTLAELKKEYSHLLDNYVMGDKSTYLTDFYGGYLTDNVKSYLTLSSIDFTSLKVEDDYQIILDETFKAAYGKLFNTDYEAKNFDYNGNKVHYVSMMNSYITTTVLTKTKTNIKREIKDIKVDGANIIITTVEGIVKDAKLYNVLDNTEIEDYNNDSLLNYSDSLNQVNYIFKDNKLISLEK